MFLSPAAEGEHMVESKSLLICTVVVRSSICSDNLFLSFLRKFYLAMARVSMCAKLVSLLKSIVDACVFKLATV